MIQRTTKDIGTIIEQDSIILRGECPFCLDKVTFRQRTHKFLNRFKIKESMLAVQCEGCRSILSFSIEKNKLYPFSQRIIGLKELPEEIQRYYDEGLRCLSRDSPNGAVTLFRKVIHALGIHYNIAVKNDSKNFYEIIKELNTEGHIVTKLKDALLGIKDIGNDGAHINDNEPDIIQAKKIRRLIDTVLKSTVLCDVDLEYVKELHSEKIKEENEDEDDFIL